MTQLDGLDIIVLVALLVGGIVYFTTGNPWSNKDSVATYVSTLNETEEVEKSRDIVAQMKQMDKNCVIFYGSQTGTAENYASRLAKEGSERFGLKTMLADLEEYDYDTLDTFPENSVAFFVVATYGEGEPTDNAVDFYQFITGEDVSFASGASANEKPLASLKYVTFGLGNNTYELFNAMARNLGNTLQRLGGNRVGSPGEGDDGAGTMEEDFLLWKESMWVALAETMALKEHEIVYSPVFSIMETESLKPENELVYLGEPTRGHLQGNINTGYSAHNPFIASILESRGLLNSNDERNCLHMEISLAGSDLTYQTGDHIAIWPTNAGAEVNRFLQVFGLKQKRHSVITIKAIDTTNKVPIPSPTTYDAAVRYYLEICAPVSRQFMSSLAAFAPDEDSKAELTHLGSDKDYFHENITAHCLNIAQALQHITQKSFSKVPFSLLLEGLHKLQPRYYSISSSSLVQPHQPSITTMVESNNLRGVTTNYLLALKQKQNRDSSPDPYSLTYAINGPRNKYDGFRVPVHVRHSNFRLPSDPSRPIIMVGPGTGVAPFRGFIHERAALSAKGERIGPTILFFGCRKMDEDFLYNNEWKVRLPQSVTAERHLR